MPKVIPKLNLNKHPFEVENGCLIDATNIIVSNDNAVIQSEPRLENSDIDSQLVSLIGDNVSYKIVYILSCNTELILFVNIDSEPNKIDLYRYNEKYNLVEYCTQIDYSGGKFIGTFTYNFNNLIIAFSEYSENDDLKIPLRTINLGNFEHGVDSQDVKQLKDSKLHSICPEILIPTIKTSYINGLAYKGWYHIFIRYKISTNTYTQWFNTNQSILVDTFKSEDIFKTFVSSDVPGINNQYTYCTSSIDISNDTDISTISFKCDINDKDVKFDYYQLGFIINRKDTTKCYRTDNINIDNDEYIFDNKFVIEESINNMITTYNNYYNSKALCTTGNRLFISNYKENNNENNIVNNLKNINIDISFKEEQIDKDYTENVKYKYDIKVKQNDADKILDIIGYSKNNKPDGYVYFTANTAPVRQGTAFHITNISGVKKIKYKDDITKEYVTEEIDVSKIIIAPFVDDIMIPDGHVPGCIYLDKGNGNVIKTSKAPDEDGTKAKVYIYMANDNSPSYIAMPYLGYDYTYTDITGQDFTYYKSYEVLNSAGIMPESPYNFFIHFVDKYGIISNGFNLNHFNINYKGQSFINNINDLIIISPNINNNSKYLTAEFKLNNIPDNYIGWFVSYEQPERFIKYKGFIGNNKEIYIDDKDTPTGNIKVAKDNYTTDSIIINSEYAGERNSHIKFIGNQLNFLDSVSINFNIVRIYNTSVIKQRWNKCVFVYKKTDGTYKDFEVKNKNILVADSYNNIGKETCFNIDLINISEVPYTYIAELINFNHDIYNNINKILIPCSNIKYTTDVLKVNTKDCFTTNIHAFYYTSEYWNNSVKYFQNSGNTKPNLYPMLVKVQTSYDELPWETLQINNKPVITFFPANGLNTTNEYEKSFYIGHIIEAKDSIDLFQQKHNTIYNNYPKTLTNYNVNNIYTNDFPKTIRRSNIIQDESHTNSWRNFELEQYKNIIENKGDITKLISIGYYFIVHCQHSMFLFNGTDSIAAKENNIQLASIDFWDTQYKEIITSNLGYAGLQREEEGIIGRFGYIFYDNDAKRFYRYDDKNVNYIDSDINNYIKKLNGYRVFLTDDKQRNRILIRLYKKDADDIILSYNYMTNTFVSRHTYEYQNGYSTKENTYIVRKYNTELQKTNIDIYKEDKYYPYTVNVMLNDNYAQMKYIEFILYKMQKIQSIVMNYSPVEGLFDLYAGDFVRIYSLHCDTGLLDFTFDNAIKQVNDVNNYIKPYWKFGNWHFNELRNKLSNYIQQQHIADECSRIFGNWFVVEFHVNSEQPVELESLDASFIKAELI